MTFSVVYIISLLMHKFDIFGGWPFEVDDDYFNITNVLIAFGIYSICSRLDKIKLYKYCTGQIFYKYKFYIKILQYLERKCKTVRRL